MDYAFVISDWSMEIVLDYLAPLRHLFKLASLSMKTVGYRSTIAKEERLAFHTLSKSCVQGSFWSDTDDQQVLPSAISPSAETQNQRVFPFVKLPLEVQDMVLARTSLVCLPQRHSDAGTGLRRNLRVLWKLWTRTSLLVSSRSGIFSYLWVQSKYKLLARLRRLHISLFASIPYCNDPYMIWSAEGKKDAKMS